MDKEVDGNKLLIVIPTWERAYAIERLLNEELAVLEEQNIDICIYDSSHGDGTAEVVKDNKRNYQNLIYERVDESIPSNDKYFDICKGKIKSKYEYIWIVQDHLIIKMSALKYLLERVNATAFCFLETFHLLQKGRCKVNL